MAIITITELPVATSAANTDVFPFVASGVTSQINAFNLAKSFELFPYTGSAGVSGSIPLVGGLSIKNPASANNIILSGDGTGYFANTVTVQSLIETSELKYKENVKDLENYSLIYKLRPVTFDWKETQKRDIGFIAEEVGDIIPELTDINQSGELEGVKYSKMSVFIIKALQEQEKEIKSLKERLEELEKRLK